MGPGCLACVQERYLENRLGWYRFGSDEGRLDTNLVKRFCGYN